MCPYLGLSTLILSQYTIFGTDLALFINIFQYLAFISLYLPTFSLIWLYLPLIAII